ncbi:MAG: serine O-acetyltransferase [Elusimicrobia bacterium]|nr:serine O-acetyltransferase [Elusimicrobiota bacterium]
MIITLWQDVKAALDRDPAARNSLEVILFYPGVHALWAHRVAHGLWRIGLKLLAKGISSAARLVTGVEIHPGATIGQGLFIDHGMGVVIGETTEIKKNVTLYQGVTLGGTALVKGKRHPTLAEGVVVGAGAKVLGAVTIGQRSRIGANAVVVKNVPADAVVVGVPGEIIKRGPHAPNQPPDFEHGKLPDVLGETLAALVRRVETLEKHHGKPLSHLPAPTHGVWHGQDFSI